MTFVKPTAVGRPTLTLAVASTVGPVVSVAALQPFLTGSTAASFTIFLHLTAVLLWAPFLPTSLSSVLLTPWREQAHSLHRGFGQTFRRWRWLAFTSPQRHLHVANVTSWLAAATWAFIVA